MFCTCNEEDKHTYWCAQQLSFLSSIFIFKINNLPLIYTWLSPAILFELLVNFNSTLISEDVWETVILAEESENWWSHEDLWFWWAFCVSVAAGFL